MPMSLDMTSSTLLGGAAVAVVVLSSSMASVGIGVGGLLLVELRPLPLPLLLPLLSSMFVGSLDIMKCVLCASYSACRKEGDYANGRVCESDGGWI